MDREQRKRMSYRTIVEDSEHEEGIEFTIQVSGQAVELHKQWEAEWDNEDGTGRDIVHECMTLNLDTLKRLIKHAEICIRESEAFEKAHPVVEEGE